MVIQVGATCLMSATSEKYGPKKNQRPWEDCEVCGDKKSLKKWKERGALVFYGSKCLKKWSNVKNPKSGKIHHGVKNLKMAIF